MTKYLGEESVEAVDFLALLDKSIILGNTAKCQFVHQVDLVRLDHMLVLIRTLIIKTDIDTQQLAIGKSKWE